MGAIPKADVPRGWFSKRQIGDILCVAAPTFEQSYRKFCAPSDVKDIGGTLFFRFRAIFDGAVEAGRRRPAEKGETDPLLASGDSPGLERYRNASADVREMERDRLRRQLFRLQDTEPRLLQLQGLLRAAGETLARRYGNDAAGVLNEALDDWERGIREVFDDDGSGRAGTTDTAGESGEGTAAADAAPVRGG